MDKRLKNLPLLRCFAAAAKHQSYSLAAVELSITQAAVSQQIRNLEQQLQVRLFRRSGRSMMLTKQGISLAESVNTAFDQLSKGFDLIQDEPLAGVLTITSSPSFSSRWLGPRLWKFSQKYPDIQVRALASDQYEDVRHSDIDVAIRQGEVLEAHVHQEVLFYDPVFPVCSPAVFQQANLTDPSQINHCDLIEPIGCDSTSFSWKDWFQLANVPLQNKKVGWMEVTTWEMGINAVLSGHGIFLTSSSMVQDLLVTGALVKPFQTQIEPGLRFSLLYDEASPRQARIDAFTQWVKQEVATQSSFLPMTDH